MLNFLYIHRHHPSSALRGHLCTLMGIAVKPPAVINIKTQVVILILYWGLICTKLGTHQPSLRALAHCVCCGSYLPSRMRKPRPRQWGTTPSDGQWTRKGGKASRRPRLQQGERWGGRGGSDRGGGQTERDDALPPPPPPPAAPPLAPWELEEEELERTPRALPPTKTMAFFPDSKAVCLGSSLFRLGSRASAARGTA